VVNTVLSQCRLRHIGFFSALFIYGVFGSPTPDHFGWAEMAVGVGLLIAIGPLQMLQRFSTRQQGVWQNAAQLLLVYGLSVPVLCGVASGHDLSVIFRDIIPFLFLLLPYFMLGWIDGSVAEKTFVTAGIVFIGVAFGARLIFPALQDGVGFTNAPDALYLSIAPTVVFAAIFLTGLAGHLLYCRVSFVSAVMACGFLLLALLPISGMVMTLQRASLGLTAAGIFLLLLIGAVRRPMRAIVPSIFCVLLLIFFAPSVGAILDSLLQKQAMVGSNMRLQEFRAVADTMDDSILHVLFGRGWGATLASPAVGGVVVNFTHSLLTSYWMKTGLVGLLIVLVYLGSLASALVRMVRVQPVLAVALFVPLAIDVILYASFKSLDFGLILLLLALWGTMRVGQNMGAVAHPGGMVYP